MTSSSTETKKNAFGRIPKRNYDQLIKILVVGDSGVGKTCLLRRFNDEPFVEFHMTTIGLDFAVKTISTQGKRLKLQIWDTAGQERFQSITQSFYRGADAMLLVFDVTNDESFQNCERWLKGIKQHTAGTPELMLIGNKVDVLVEQRMVPSMLAQEFAQQNGIPYIETSAKESIGVDEAFVSLATRCLEARENRERVQLERQRSSHSGQPSIFVKDAKRRRCPGCVILNTQTFGCATSSES